MHSPLTHARPHHYDGRMDESHAMFAAKDHSDGTDDSSMGNGVTDGYALPGCTMESSPLANDMSRTPAFHGVRVRQTSDTQSLLASGGRSMLSAPAPHVESHHHQQRLVQPQQRQPSAAILSIRRLCIESDDDLSSSHAHSPCSTSPPASAPVRCLATHSPPPPPATSSTRHSHKIRERASSRSIAAAVSAPAPAPPALAAEDEPVCCICMEPYTTDNPQFRAACAHHFHLACLLDWKQRSNACPMCCCDTLRGVGDGEDEAGNVAAPPGQRAPAGSQPNMDLDQEIALRLQRKYLRRAKREIAHRREIEQYELMQARQATLRPGHDYIPDRTVEAPLVMYLTPASELAGDSQHATRRQRNGNRKNVHGKSGCALM